MSYPNRLPDVIINSSTENFTIIPNELLKNKQLSWKAKGLLSFLLSHKDNEWYSYKQTILNYGTDGPNSVDSGLKELENFGYLMKLYYRDKDKRKIRGSIWVCSDFPDQIHCWKKIKQRLDEYDLEPVSIAGNKKKVEIDAEKTKHEKVENRESCESLNHGLTILNYNNTNEENNTVVSKDTTNAFLVKNASCNNSEKRKRKRKKHLSEETNNAPNTSKSNMKEKAKQKASSKAPKHKSKPKHETQRNVAAIKLWNEYCSKNKKWQKCLIKSDSQTYRKTLRKLHELFNGILNYSEDQLIHKNIAPKLSKKFTFDMFRKSLEVLNQKIDPKYYPKNKDWMTGLSLQNAIMNFSGSAANLHEAYYLGLQEIYQPKHELETEEQKQAFDILNQHFSKFSTLDISSKKIVSLIKEIDKEYYVLSFASSVDQAIKGVDELGSSLYDDQGFKLTESKHSPNSLYPGKATFNAINEAHKHVYNSELLKKRPSEAEMKKLKKAEESQNEYRKHEETLFKIRAMESKGKIDLVEIVNNRDDVIGLEVNGIQIARKNGKGYLEVNDNVVVDKDSITVGKRRII
jgi:hypothetical protein